MSLKIIWLSLKSNKLGKKLYWNVDNVSCYQLTIVLMVIFNVLI